MDEKQIIENFLKNGRIPHKERELLPGQIIRFSVLKKVLSEILTKQNKLPNVSSPDQMGETIQIEKLQNEFVVRRSSEYSYLKFKFVWEKEINNELDAIEFYIKENHKAFWKEDINVDWNA